jgi:chromosome partitioning protein
MLLAVAGQKGGAGKSTAACMLAAEGVRRGRRVLAVDADPQATLRTWAAVAAQRRLDAPTVVAMDATLARPDQLPRLAAGFDLVLIDCPGRMDTVVRAALMVSDLVVVPCQPSGPDVWALAGTVALVAEARTLRPTLRARVLVTMRDGTALSRAARDGLARDAGVPLLATELGRRVAYREAMAAGEGVCTYAPSSPADFEVRKLFEEVTHGEESADRDPRPSPVDRGSPAKRT